MKITGEAPVEKRHRILCQYPKVRPLGQAQAKPPESFREKVARAIDRQKNSNAGEERRIFVDETRSVNCPIARAQTGTWRVEGAPCPLCEHYRGLIFEKRLFRKPRKHAVLCSHYKGLQVRPGVTGDAVFGD